METGGEVSSLRDAFAKLPNDLLIPIFSNLPRMRDLAQVALVCKRFRNFVEPILYQCVHLLIPCIPTGRNKKYHPRFRRDGLGPDGNRRAFLANIRVLKKNSHLIQYITAIDTVTCHCNQLESLAVHDRLLDLVPHLKEFRSWPPPQELDVSQLKCLEVLRVGSSVYKCGYSNSFCVSGTPLDLLARHLWMPSLRQLEIVNEHTRFIRISADHYFPESKRGTSSITDLCIIQGSYSDRTIEYLPDICHAFKALKKFVVQLDGHWSHFSRAWSGTEEDRHRITSAIQPHYSTLEDLFLVGPFRWPVEGKMFDLSNFRSLRRLAIPCNYLTQLSHDVEIFDFCERLPPSLEQLQIQSKTYRDVEKTRQGMEDLAKTKRASFPALKGVIDWVHFATDSSLNGDAKGCHTCQRDKDTRLFAEVDVKYELIMQENFSGTPL
ncbi:hypothetical protein MMC11_007076, partial [Xylographa trunciseda]|nr:hypothetical protein [Xylographa trunciseda]